MAPIERLGDKTRLVCSMVGLPARGKTFLARKICRYLAWLGFDCRVFNVGAYRRKNCGHPSSAFFDPHNEETTKLRNACAMMALDDMMRYFRDENGGVAFYDATNSTKERRAMIVDRCQAEGISIIFIESICNLQDVILQNVREVKISSPDYQDFVGREDEAVEDFLKRIKHYESGYEGIDSEAEKDTCYIKLIDVGTQCIINKCHGYLQSRIVYYLMNLHIKPRSIYLTRHGESELNLVGRIGGDASLSPRGKKFAAHLPELINRIVDKDGASTESPQVVVWTSTLKRTIETSAHLSEFKHISWKSLDELDAGVCDGLSFEEIDEKFPEEAQERGKDKFNYRYKGGESYRDLVNRLEPVIMELERHRDPTSILVIGHQAVLRAIYAYFMNFNHEELPYINIPLHTVIKLTPKAYGCSEERFAVDVPAVDTWRPRPVSAEGGHVAHGAFSPSVGFVGLERVLGA